MPSQLKSETARANGAKSKGPLTAATREKSSLNSIRHGLTARKNVVLSCENAGDFQQLFDEYLVDFHPAPGIEMDLLEQMVAATWRIRRLWTIEAALMDLEMARHKANLPKEIIDTYLGIHLGLVFQKLTDESRATSLASCYEARFSRIHDRARRTLCDLQDRRKKNEQTNPPPETAGLPQSPALEPPILASTQPCPREPVPKMAQNPPE